MKKIFVSIILSVLYVNVLAQNDVISEMCGVKFGSDKQTAKEILTSKFGYPSDDDFQYLGFENIIYAGVRFDIAFFSFQHDGARSYLNDIMLIIKCKTPERAKEVREYLRSILEMKYELASGIGDNGFRFYQGGTSPTDSDCYGFELYVRKDVSTKGYIVNLKYGEYDYTDESL